MMMQEQLHCRDSMFAQSELDSVLCGVVSDDIVFDAAEVSRAGIATISPSSSASSLAPKRNQRSTSSLRSCIPFPWKLHEMLDAAAEEGVESIVSWLPNNRSFKVFDTKLFTETIMKRYFKQTKYKSFQRQLNIWGFRRIHDGDGRGGYYHAHLVRGQAYLCRNMTRTKVKGTGMPLNETHSLLALKEQKKVLKQRAISTSIPFDPEQIDTTASSSALLASTRGNIAMTQAISTGETRNRLVSSFPFPSIPSSLEIEDIEVSNLVEPVTSESDIWGIMELDTLFDEDIKDIPVPEERRSTLSFTVPKEGACMNFEGRAFCFVPDYIVD